MILEFFLLHHDVYIINNEEPLLLLGKDWTTKYNVIYYDMTYIRLGKTWIPIIQAKEKSKQDPMELVDLDEEELILNEETDEELEIGYLEIYGNNTISLFDEDLSNHSYETDGLLIDLTTLSEEEIEGNTILPMNRDILELDAQIFQQDFNGMIPIPPDIMSEPIEEKAIRRLENTSLQKKNKKQSNKKLLTKETNNQRKCYLCKCRGHTMKDCKLEPIFRNHEQNCKRYGIHVWKNWKPPDELKLVSKRA
jgi:hypothetical protein